MAGITVFAFLNSLLNLEMTGMNINNILQDVLRQAKEIGIPVSDKIDPTVILNTRAKKRYGRCILQNGTYTIEISAYLVDAGLRTIHEVVVHEVLHTCPGCMNHGPLWKQYASMMTKRYGYTVERTAKTPLITEKPAEARYILQCSNCGIQIRRMKKSSVVEHPERYRCTCGGRLIRLR